MRQLPVERLRFEHEKRQSKIPGLQLQLSRLQRQMDELQSDWGEAYNEAASRPGGVSNFDASGFQNGERYFDDQIASINRRLSEVNEEMQAIDVVLSSKWK